MKLKNQLLQETYGLTNAETELINSSLFECFKEDFNRFNKVEVVEVYSTLYEEDFNKLKPVLKKIYMIEEEIPTGKPRGFWEIVKSVFSSQTVKDGLSVGWTVFSIFNLIRVVSSMFKKQDPNMSKQELETKVREEVEKRLKEKENIG